MGGKVSAAYANTLADQLKASNHDYADSQLAKQGQDAALKQLITGKNLEAENTGKKIQASIGGLQQMSEQGLVPEGGSASVEGTSVGADPYAKLMGKQMQGGAHAIEAAQKTYNSGLQKIMPAAQAASEGMQLMSDPKNTGSLGQARTLMLKAMGMNRYNEQEAKAVLPPSLQGTVSQIFNSAGGDETPLNDSQKRSVATFFKGQLDQAKQAHETLKANSLNMYQQSPYFDAARGSQLQGSLGAPVDSVLKSALDKYSGMPDTRTDPSQRPAPTGMVDKLRQFLTGGGSSQPSAQSTGLEHLSDAELQQMAKQAGVGH